MEFTIEKIEMMIYSIRNQRVMLDSDLAKLYGVETKVLNQAVRRNLKRFPDDFMFQLTSDEYHFLKSQFVTSKNGSGGKQKQPLVFTENGVAMLSGILNIDKDDVGQLKKNTNHLFKIVFEKLDNLEEQVTPKLPANRKKIGLQPSRKD
jgi:hypothetical protein